MKTIRCWFCLAAVLAVLLACLSPVAAIGFKPEEAYESVFVIHSGEALGSGFALGSNCIVTNAHVLDDVSDIVVYTYDGQVFRAYALGMDMDADIAVLVVPGENFTCLPVSDLEDVNIGDDIYAIGAPKNMAYTLTKGVISAKERMVSGNSYIQIDAAINHGNSGGPLLDDSGRVVGMNTMKMSDSEGIGLAIPIDRIGDYLLSLGIPLDSRGNVSGELEKPGNVTDSPLPIPDDDEQTPFQPPQGRVNDGELFTSATWIAIVVAGISICVNIILVMLLVGRRRSGGQESNLPDRSERTDFDIIMLE